MKPTAARIVLYVLSQADCDSIEASRARMAELLQISAGQIGNSVKPGDIVPAIIVRAWSDTCVNAQAILDGGDTHWLMSRSLDAEKSHQSWHWPERVPVQAEAIAELACERRDRLTLDDLTEKLYAAYCAMVGGKAFNGDVLPTWSEFAADGGKVTQANAWRAVATTAIAHLC